MQIELGRENVSWELHKNEITGATQWEWDKHIGKRLTEGGVHYLLIVIIIVVYIVVIIVIAIVIIIGERA